MNKVENQAGQLRLTQELITGNGGTFVQILGALADSATANKSRETFKKLDPFNNFVKNDSLGSTTVEYSSAIVPLLTYVNGTPTQEAKEVTLGVNKVLMFPYISVKNLKENGEPKDEKDIIWDFAPATFNREELSKQSFAVIRDQLALILNGIYCLDTSNDGEYVSTLITLGDIIALDSFITERNLPKQDLTNVQKEFVVSREFTLILIHLLSVIEAKVTGNLKMNIEEDETFRSMSQATLETIKSIATLYPSVAQKSDRVETTVNYGSSIAAGSIQYGLNPIKK